MESRDFVTTGDPKQDEPLRKRLERTDRLIAEALCPNGCGPMVISARGEDCPKCGFTHRKAVVRPG